ncbi:MAG: type II secretion system F family protein [Bacteroidota bacterium]
MRFQIVAYRPNEGVVSLSLDAASFDQARAMARERNIDIVSIRQKWHWAAQRRRKDPPFDLLLFSQELRSLIDAGLSLNEALITLARKENNATRRQLIEVLIRQVREGKPFSAALREFPAIFPPLYVALAAASEQTGDLGSSLGRFVAYRSQMDQARQRLVSAAIYPSLLIGVGGLVVVFLMTYVVPRFSRIYEEFGRNLPFMSRLLMRWGIAVDTHGFEILLGMALLATALTLAIRHAGNRRSLLHRLLALKGLRALRLRFRAYALSRFFRTLGLLQREGIPIVGALGLARELLDEEGRLELDHVILDVRAGVALSEAMERRDLAPPVASELLKVGEKTGDVGEKMIRIADFYDEELARWSEWFLKLFEPLLMLTIGGFIAFIVVLLYLPIFELAGNL